MPTYFQTLCTFFLLLVEIAYSCSINIVTTDVGFSNVRFMPPSSVLTKLFFSQTRYFLTRQNIFCPGQKFCPQLKNHFCFEETCLKAWTKFLSWTKNILLWTKLICLRQNLILSQTKNILSGQMDWALGLFWSLDSKKSLVCGHIACKFFQSQLQLGTTVTY